MHGKSSHNGQIIFRLSLDYIQINAWNHNIIQCPLSE